MSDFATKVWTDRPPELNPVAGETVYEWFARIAAYDATNPGVLTPLDASNLNDLEARILAITTVPGAPVNANYITGALATNARETGVLAMSTAYRVKLLTTDRAARVRLYDTAAHRDADAARVITADPAPGSGCMFEAVTDATHLVLPAAEDGWASSANVPITIDNLGATGAVNVTIQYVRTEP